MGSGLILFVIVGAWLVVLVPMGLRGHDGAPSRSTERIGDAMRVLSRRSAGPGHEVADDDLVDDLDDDDDGLDGPRWHWLEALLGWRPTVGRRALLRLPTALMHRAVALLRGARAVLADRRAALADRRGALADRRGTRRPATPSARRRRVLLGLLLVAVLAGAAGQVGPAWLVDVAGAALVAALLFLVSCRRQAIRRADARALPAERLEAQRRAELRRTRVVSRTRAPAVVAEPAVLTEPAAVAEPVAVPERTRPGLGAEWQPVPVPLPTYVSKPVAPRRPAALPEAEPEPEVWVPESADDEQGVFEPRRVVSGW